MKRLSLLFTLSTLASFIFGQTYGNEWINYSQEYYKFKIGKTGLYVINQSTLKSIGIDVSAIDPRNIDIYRNGSPIQIYVSGEKDGTLDTSDYIEFLGHANDGSLDESLYANKNDHTNPCMSSTKFGLLG
jgi:hypothetical protein